MTQHNTGLSAMQLSQDVGVSYNKSWMMKHKLIPVMLVHQHGQKLSDGIDIGDAYIGGGFKRGRSSHNNPVKPADLNKKTRIMSTYPMCLLVCVRMEWNLNEN